MRVESAPSPIEPEVLRMLKKVSSPTLMSFVTATETAALSPMLPLVLLTSG